MKRIIIGLIALMLNVNVFGLALICYPPYNSSCQGPSCFGSKGDCNTAPWNSCPGNNTGCICCAAMIPSIDMQWELTSEDGKVAVYDVSDPETVFSTNIRFEDLLVSDDYVFKYNVITSLNRIQFVIYDRLVIEELILAQAESFESAIISTVNYDVSF